jgi:hypothetical protein
VGLLLGLLRLAPTHAAAGESPAAATPMEITICDGPTETTRALARMKLFKQVGATSVQTYIYWKDIETAPGKFTWDLWDQYVTQLKASGLKWVPFVVAGPWYLTPEFARPKDKVTFARCLEHNQESLVPSIWDPAFKKNIETYLQAFADHFLPTGAFESINLGITGDYGEAIFQVSGNWPGSYHTHPGMWCGDRYAVADFQRHCREFYANDLARLNIEWHTCYGDFAEIKPFNRQHAPSMPAWVFMVRWYRDSMTAYADWWLATARRIFKTTPLYLCTGGSMAVEHGSDFSAQVKTAARYQAGVRITNEASSLPANVYLTRLVASSARFYKGFCGFEPAATVTPIGTLGRLYNAHASGARQLFVYSGNILDGDQLNSAGLLLERHRSSMVQTHPQNEIAVLYGTTNWIIERLEEDLFYRLRDGFEYDFVDERMALDGALDHYKVLVVNNLRWIPRPVVARIHEWVKQGGTLLTLNTRAMDLDEQTAPWDDLVGFTSGTQETYSLSLEKMRRLDAKILPSFEKANEWIVGTAMKGLTSDSTVLLRMGEPAGGTNAWRRPVGKGLVLGYWGPGNLATAEGDWNALPPLICLFLKDALRHVAAEGRIAGVPGRTWEAGPPVYFTPLQGGRLVAFNPDPGATRAFEWRKQTYQVPPQSISHLGPITQ